MDIDSLGTVGGIYGQMGLDPRLLVPLIYSAMAMYLAPAFISILWIEWLNGRFGERKTVVEPAALSVAPSGTGVPLPRAPEKRRAA